MGTRWAGQSSDSSRLADGPVLRLSEPGDLGVEQPLGSLGTGVIVATTSGGEGGQRQGLRAAGLSVGEDLWGSRLQKGQASTVAGRRGVSWR